VRGVGGDIDPSPEALSRSRLRLSPRLTRLDAAALGGPAARTARRPG
jgi:hypothetical protein